MKRVSLLGAIVFMISLSLNGQTVNTVLLVNGGQYGNQNENVNIQLHDPALNTTRVIDTIHTQSVQDLIIDGNDAFVAAQDSIVKYSLDTEKRLAAARFFGPSTYSIALYQNQLLVGNWFSKSSHNLYFYDANNLTVLDSMAAFTKGVKSILINNGFAYVTQNEQTSGFQDTLGMIIKVDLSNRSIADTIQVSNYSGDFGELIEKPSQTGFYAFNSVSNTITSVDYASPGLAANTAVGLNLRISSSSHWVLNQDTLYGRMHDGIGAINLNNLQIIDSSFIDTVVTAFTFDSTRGEFFVTQTDFFSYNSGRVFDRNGSALGNFPVGFAPEVIGIFPPIVLSLNEGTLASNDLDIYPNPANELVNFEVINDRAELSLFNMQGQLLLQASFSRGKQQISLEEIPQGMYLMVLRSEAGMRTQKLMVD